MRLKTKVFLAALGTSFAACLPIPAGTVLASEPLPATVTQYGDIVAPQSDNLRWAYKVENGKRYKRLYNASKNIWIGDWILCP
ncbi:MAG: hypothetical protein NC254_10700 [bacterium]|nr:hypothetical protein [bacterium]